MNAAAKTINQGNFFNGQWMEMRFTKEFFFAFSLLLTVLVSALSVVYVTNEHRVAFSQLQQLKRQTVQLKLQWGQLLLEQASLATPARVEQLAEEKLNMRLPIDKETFLLRTQ